MKWILCGKKDAAVECLEFLVSRGDEVWVIATEDDDGVDGWQRSLVKAAHQLGARVHQPARINAPEFIETLRGFNAAALISIQYDQILKAPLFAEIGCPCLNFHFALLPRHRGVSPIAWAIALGDAEAGVTLHHMVVDIDAGDVIAQRAVPIAQETTARELHDAISDASVELFRESYPFPPALLDTRLAQDASQACYHRAGEFDFSARAIDWKRPAAELHAWVRSMIFPPLQHPELTSKGRALRIRAVDGAILPTDAAPGTVLAVARSGVRVAANGGSLCITDLADESGEPLSASCSCLLMASFARRVPGRASILIESCRRQWS